MRTQTFTATLCTLLLLQAGADAHRRSTGVHPPPGYRAYHATMYGNERTRSARRVSSRHTASGRAFQPDASAFAMNGALGQTFRVWTPGHGVATAVCDDTGADHPDLAYGFFRRMYYQLPSRGGERRNWREAGVMTIWMKRITSHREGERHRGRR